MSLSSDDRKAASADQIEQYFYEQAAEWRVDVVKSIRKIILNQDWFYDDEELSVLSQTERNIFLTRTRNGWFFEAISQAIQSIEDLFATIMKCTNVDYFIKDVLYYNASKLKKFIWDFDL